ncbi:MAG: hypothetical protein AB1627_07055 [Chloroflexota bacterium]
MDLLWVILGQIALPILVGVLVVALSPRWPRVGSSPFVTAFVLYLVLVTLTALAAPGYDLWVPVVGGLVSLVVSVAVFISLRRRAPNRTPGAA